MTWDWITMCGLDTCTFLWHKALFYGPSHSSKHDSAHEAVLGYDLQSALKLPVSHDFEIVSSVPSIPYNKANKIPSIYKSPTLYTVFLEDNHLLSPRQHISLISKPYLLSCNYTKSALQQCNSSSEKRTRLSFVTITSPFLPFNSSGAVSIWSVIGLITLYKSSRSFEI